MSIYIFLLSLGMCPNSFFFLKLTTLQMLTQKKRFGVGFILLYLGGIIELLIRSEIVLKYRLNSQYFMLNRLLDRLYLFY